MQNIYLNNCETYVKELVVSSLCMRQYQRGQVIVGHDGAHFVIF